MSTPPAPADNATNPPADPPKSAGEFAPGLPPPSEGQRLVGGGGLLEFQVAAKAARPELLAKIALTTESVIQRHAAGSQFLPVHIDQLRHVIYFTDHEASQHRSVMVYLADTITEEIAEYEDIENVQCAIHYWNATDRQISLDPIAAAKDMAKLQPITSTQGFELPDVRAALDDISIRFMPILSTKRRSVEALETVPYRRHGASLLHGVERVLLASEQDPQAFPLQWKLIEAACRRLNLAESIDRAAVLIPVSLQTLIGDKHHDILRALINLSTAYGPRFGVRLWGTYRALNDAQHNLVAARFAVLNHHVKFIAAGIPDHVAGNSLIIENLIPDANRKRLISCDFDRILNGLHGDTVSATEYMLRLPRLTRGYPVNAYLLNAPDRKMATALADARYSLFSGPRIMDAIEPSNTNIAMEAGE